MFFDVETLNGSANNPWQISNPQVYCEEPNLTTFHVWESLVQQRGEQLGRIFQAEAPGALFHTTWMLSVLNDYGDPFYDPGNDRERALCRDPNGLLVSFLMGFLAVPTQPYVPIVDGNEYWYYAKDACDYATIFYNIKGRASVLLPESYRPRYASTVTVSQPIFLNYLMAESPYIPPPYYAPTYCLLPPPNPPTLPDRNLALLRHRIYTTLQWSDRYAWVGPRLLVPFTRHWHCLFRRATTGS
jgi:hypothetical protein